MSNLGNLNKEAKLHEEIKRELCDPYRGLRQTSNTNKSYSNIMALVEEYGARRYNNGLLDAEEIALKLIAKRAVKNRQGEL